MPPAKMNMFKINMPAASILGNIAESPGKFDDRHSIPATKIKIKILMYTS